MPILKRPCVYILASGRNGTLYIGVTSDLIKRVYEHKNDAVGGFTKAHQIHTLVWFEQHEMMESAILREKAIKEWKRAWKLELIEKSNPYWRDLYDDMLDLQA
jgi:putative endonuclease